MSITINGTKHSMKLYLVSVDEFDYDTFDSAVVCAIDEGQALRLSKELFHPCQGDITIKCIGYADGRTEPEIILSPFIAG